MPAHIIWKEDNGKKRLLPSRRIPGTFPQDEVQGARTGVAQAVQPGQVKLGAVPHGERVRPSVRVRDHKQIFDRHIIPRFGNTVLTDVKVADLRRWQAELLKGGLKVKTVRNIMDSSFRAMYRDARGEHVSLEGKDPFLDLKWPKAKRLAPDPLSVEEKRRVLNSFAESEPWYYPFMRFQFDTGCRPSETIALTSADITPETRRVSINKSRHLSSDNDHPKTTHSER